MQKEKTVTKQTEETKDLEQEKNINKPPQKDNQKTKNIKLPEYSDELEEIILSDDEKKKLPKKIKINGIAYKRTTTVTEPKKDLTEADKQMIKHSQRIKYKPPLSYRWLKIFGMLCLLVPFILLRLVLFFPSISDSVFDTVSIIADTLSLPLILFAAFVFILKAKNKKAMIITYALLAVVIYLVMVFLFERYLLSFLKVLHPEMTPEEIRAYASEKALGMKIFHYNIFIDLTLCSAFYYFCCETPKKFANSSKKMIAFRLCAIIPVLYMVVSMILCGLLNSGALTLDVEFVGLLTCRSPASYLAFFSIALCLAIRQSLYLKKGGTPQGYEVYTKTNGHSVQFSIACSIIIAVVCLLDFLIGLIPGSINYGWGDSKFMFVIIPFIMLISYTKEHKNKTIDLFLPIATFGLIFFLLADSIFTLLVS